MKQRAPSHGLPLRRKSRSKWPVVVTLTTAVGAVCLVVFSALRHQSSETAPVDEDPVTKPAGPVAPKPLHLVKPSAPPKVPAIASINHLKPGKGDEEKVSALKALLAKKAAEVVPMPAPVTKEVPKLKAMPANEIRDEFEKAASVLRDYFQSPSPDKLETLVRHPDQTMLRLREWSLTRRLVPAQPLQIGPQFGVSGSLLITNIKLDDGSLRIAALEKTDRGYRLDWESFSAWGESRFADLNHLQPGTTALMRVSIRPSSATPPAHAQGGASYTITHPDERTTLAAYADAKTLQASLQSRRLWQAGSGMFTLRLGVEPEDVKEGRARICEVVCTGWMPEFAEAPSSSSE
ncbi:MAG: hypothetical protein R3F13_15625 [Prosthecobacter sp.]